MPQLPTRRRGPDSYLGSLKALLSLSPPHTTRPQLLRALVTRSVAIPLSRDGRITLPVRVRPAMIFFTFLCLLLLGFLGLTPSPNGGLPISDKPLHFLSFFLSTLLFYFIFSIPSSTLSHTPSLRHFPLLFTLFVCLGLGAIASEFVQGALPYKIFDWWDILANLLGGGLGLIVARWGEREWRKKKELRRIYTSLGQAEDGDEFDEVGELLSEGSEGDQEQDREGQLDIWTRGGRGGGISLPQDLDLEDPWSTREEDGLRESTRERGGSVPAASKSSSTPPPTLSQVKGEDLFAIEDEDE